MIHVLDIFSETKIEVFDDHGVLKKSFLAVMPVFTIDTSKFHEGSYVICARNVLHFLVKKVEIHR